MIAQWPVWEESLNFAAEEAEFTRVMDAIKAVRNVRTEMNVPPSKKASLFIETKFADKDKFEVTEWAAQYGIPCGPVMSMKELAHDPSLQKVGTVVEVVDEIRGNHLTVGAPFKFSGFQPEITRAPLLGEHTDEVLKELGLDDAKIKELHAKQVV